MTGTSSTVEPEPYRVRRFDEAGSFVIRAEPWLMAREAENNLILGISRSLAAGGTWFEPPLYLATVERAGDVVGAAFRTPPFKLGLTRMPLGAVTELGRSVAEVYDEIGAVLGPVAVARAFASHWAERVGRVARPGMAQRIYQLERVVPPPRRSPGLMRQATAGDGPMLITWADAFHEDTGINGGRSEPLVNDLITRGRMFLWEDDGAAVCMAATMGDTPNGSRVGYVYTPAEARGRGYASALTARLSQRLLDLGRRFCCLYADASSPTPNRIYQQIGYEPVCDVMDVEFV
jgi:GNAT superfamily N-acetyltransferase